jgi:spoIIIJ-associated protein
MEKIKKIVEEIFQIMGIGDVDVEIKKDNSLKDKEVLTVDIEVSSRDAKCFLDESAVGLNALQHLVRIIVFKGVIGRVFLVMDINGYKKERERILTDLALKTAQKVRRAKKPIILEPMPAYERRFIHLKLAEQPDIATESIGEEPERKIVVRLYP